MYHYIRDQDGRSLSAGPKDLLSVPAYVAVKLQDWVEDVEDRGIELVRRIPGYHDEPLKGSLRGLRSIRLSKGYRAYYRVVEDEIRVLERGKGG